MMKETPARAAQGLPVQLAGEQDCPSEIPAESQLDSDPVRLFYPAARAEELELRRRLHRARDIASSRVGCLQTRHGQVLNEVLIETASAFVFAGAAPDELQDAVDMCVRLFMCAAAAERLGCGA